jgi:hypothetical protein
MGIDKTTHSLWTAVAANAAQARWVTRGRFFSLAPVEISEFQAARFHLIMRAVAVQLRLGWKDDCFFKPPPPHFVVQAVVGAIAD